jgi:FHS family L-fucose permease-like MFS transporter
MSFLSDTSYLLLILVSVNSGEHVAVWSMIAVGFCNSIMFAIIFSLSVNGLGKFTARASGLLSAAIVGGAIIPFAQGIVKDNFTCSVAFMIPLACYIYILFYGINGHKTKYIK